ncbi:MAG: hypothetical protein KDG89_11640 [Geminicoccaceae bacterium]|nr:hypothetical protein [Geminicoccaceae bacterium]
MLERPPAVRLLCEREVLERTDWPSREYLDARIRSDGFPRPRRRVRSLGDQWLESEVALWIEPGGLSALEASLPALEAEGAGARPRGAKDDGDSLLVRKFKARRPAT